MEQMEPTRVQAKTRIPRGKFNGINAVADERGIIAAAAMDQRGSLRKAIAKARGGDASAADLSEFKVLVPDLLPEWSVRRLIDVGADVIKILMYYDPDDTKQINTIKEAFIERIGAECRAYAVPFFLEVLAYINEIGDENSLAFARVKPAKVKKYMQEFSQPQYGVDVLKVEVPINMRYVKGSRANPDGQVAYSREEAKQHFREAAAATRVPFIYLSAGVSDEVFRQT